MDLYANGTKSVKITEREIDDRGGEETEEEWEPRKKKQKLDQY